jgi:hypothetical protein
MGAPLGEIDDPRGNARATSGDGTAFVSAQALTVLALAAVEFVGLRKARVAA